MLEPCDSRPRGATDVSASAYLAAPRRHSMTSKHSPRTPRRSLASGSLVLIGALALGAPAAAQVAPLPEIKPGPYDVAMWDWDFGTLTTTGPATGQPLTVGHFGRLWYPTDGSGGALPPVASGTHPLVVYGHGRYHTAPFIGSNHEGADYLMAHLASWGIVASSVNLDVVGQFGVPAAIPQRGDILLETLQRTIALASQPGTPPSGLAAAIDASRLGLGGHSRGGEGVVAALVANAAEPSPLPILAAGTIAPTDFEAYTAPADVPYMGLYGTKDGDVNNGWPIYVHDRSEATEKVFENIQGANHFWFTEDITCSCEGPADISRKVHHAIAKGYLGGFLVRKLLTAPAEGSAVFCDGAEMAPLTSIVEIHPMYRDPGRFVIDDFEQNPGLALTSEGTPALATHLANYESSFQSGANTLYHKTSGLNAAWAQSIPGVWAALIDPAGFDATPWSQLSVKFTQRRNSPVNVPDLDQDVALGLMDTDLDLALVPLSSFGTIPWPIKHSGTFTQVFPPKSVLRTTRVPLSAFVAANPSLDLDRILYAGWLSGVTQQGEVQFDDIEFSD